MITIVAVDSGKHYNYPIVFAVFFLCHSFLVGLFFVSWTSPNQPIKRGYVSPSGWQLLITHVDSKPRFVLIAFE